NSLRPGLIQYRWILPQIRPASFIVGQTRTIRGRTPVPRRGKLPCIFISNEIKPFTPITYLEKEKSCPMEMGSSRIAAEGSSAQGRRRNLHKGSESTNQWQLERSSRFLL
ncbi:hypothetical protein TorRG33x02_230560, partial [Trema orientale]